MLVERQPAIGRKILQLKYESQLKELPNTADQFNYTSDYLMINTLYNTGKEDTTQRRTRNLWNIHAKAHISLEATHSNVNTGRQYIFGSSLHLFRL